MGSVTVIRMKRSCLPSRFECQPDRLKRTSKRMPRSVVIKRERASLIQETLEQTVDTQPTSNIELQHSNIRTGGKSVLKLSQCI